MQSNLRELPQADKQASDVPATLYHVAYHATLPIRNRRQAGDKRQIDSVNHTQFIRITIIREETAPNQKI